MRRGRISRRAVLKSVAAVGAAVAGGLGLTALSRPANAYYAGPISDHFDGVVFYNAGARPPRGFENFLKLYITERWERWPDRVETGPPDVPPPRVEGPRARIAFVGHASWLVQAAGLNILIDPVWSQRASPVSFAGPRRANAPGIAFDTLPPVDVVLVTHNHYDHLDVATLRRLAARDRPRVITPLGNDTIIRREVPELSPLALDWQHSHELSARVQVHVEPTLHWSARGMRDRRHALWASFVIETPAGKIYAVGDSGFGDGSLFAEVGQRHRDLALALLPIGAYEPRWFMRDQHMNPAEAVEALRLSGARMALGHHWGTFPLTAEGPDSPRLALARALAEAGIAAQAFRAVRPGEVHMIEA